MTKATPFFMFQHGKAQAALDFTPSWPFFVDREGETETDRLFATLSEGRQALMPLDNYGWSRRFGWVSDKFGASWQINLQ